MKPSLNGCYYYFYSQDLHNWKEVSFSVCVSVKFSPHRVPGGLHQFFVEAVPAPNLEAPEGLLPVPTLKATGAMESLARTLAFPLTFSD